MFIKKKKEKFHPQVTQLGPRQGAQLVGALSHALEVCGFDLRWSHIREGNRSMFFSHISLSQINKTSSGEDLKTSCLKRLVVSE